MFRVISHISYTVQIEHSILNKYANLETENKKLIKQNQDLKTKISSYKKSVIHAQAIGNWIVKRTANNVTANVASLVKKATPYIGAALVVLDTKNDVEYGCQTIRDMNELLQSF